MEWLSLSPTDTEPTLLPNQGSLSSHRQHGDGTYSLSSQLTVPSSVSPGTKIICSVSHVALDTPLSVSLVVESPEPGMTLYTLCILKEIDLVNDLSLQLAQTINTTTPVQQI